MKAKTIPALMLTTIFILSSMLSPANAAALAKDDFLLDSFDKTVDFFDYARTYALSNGIQTPPGFQNYHAYMYMTYVNTSGLHLLYAGLDNVTFGGGAAFRIPMQSFIMHYKTNNHTRDVVLASTFLMLLAFNETADSIHDNSPDMNDTLWASFSLGFDLSALNATLPFLNSKTEAIPLTHSSDKLQWSWGMKYTNLTAYWWRTWINPADPRFNQTAPAAITVYDELTFTYNLTIDPMKKTAELTENHVIGRMRHLLIGIPLLWVHYNSTGTYWLGMKISNETIHDFINDNGIKMSIVNFQTTILADRETYCRTAGGVDVADAEVPVTNTTIATYADDGEKICEASFGAKRNYSLFNYTQDPTETNHTSYDAVVRTTRGAGYAGNAGLFVYHLGLMKFLPLVMIHMYPGMYVRARDTIANMSRANYFYTVAYPVYSGYRVEHDPTLTVYLSTSAATTPGDVVRPFLGVLLIGGAIATTVILAAVVVKLRKRPRTTTSVQMP